MLFFFSALSVFLFSGFKCSANIELKTITSYSTLLLVMTQRVGRSVVFKAQQNVANQMNLFSKWNGNGKKRFLSVEMLLWKINMNKFENLKRSFARNWKSFSAVRTGTDNEPTAGQQHRINSNETRTRFYIHIIWSDLIYKWVGSVRTRPKWASNICDVNKI